MSLEEIKKYLTDIVNNTSSSYQKDPGYERCKEYTDNNVITGTIDNFIDIDIWDCAACLYYIKSKGTISIDESFQEFSNINDCMKDFSFIEISAFLDIVMATYDFQDKDRILSYVLETDEEKANDKFNEIMEEFEKHKVNPDDDLTAMSEYLQLMRSANSNGSVLQLFNFIDKNQVVASNVLAYIRTYYEMEFYLKRFNKMGEGFDNVPTKYKNKVFANFCKREFDSSSILGEHNIIFEFVRDEEKKEKNYIRNNLKLINAIKDVLSQLDILDNKKEITDFRKLIRSIRDPEIQRKILEYVDSHNRVYYKELEGELYKLSSNSINLYQGVLSKYKISVHPSKIQDIMHHSLEDLKIILSSIPKGLFDDIEILFILKFTTKEIVEKIKKYIDLGFINKEFLKEHVDFYQNGSVIFSKFEESIKFLNKHGINPKNFKDNPILLTINSDSFMNNILYLEEYDYLRYLKTTSDYQFLLESNLINKIDKIIELGYEKYLIEDLGILNYDISRFKRLELLKNMNMPITDLEGFVEILDSNKFIVPDSEIDSFLMNVTPYMKNNYSFVSIEELESYRDKSVYIFDGVCISYHKVKRKLMEGSSLIEAITYGKNMTIDEYQTILRIISSNNNQNDTNYSI